jgi:hypothetical protein
MRVVQLLIKRTDKQLKIETLAKRQPGLSTMRRSRYSGHPKMVTLPGSPQNCAVFYGTYRRAITCLETGVA